MRENPKNIGKQSEYQFEERKKLLHSNTERRIKSVNKQ